MAEQTALLPISEGEDPERLADVMFVHGLDGNARSTWHPKDQPEHFWPSWLGEEMPQLGVWALNYAVSDSAWKGHSMPLVGRANNVLDLFALEDIGQRPLALICHSLGSLLMKQVLRTAGRAGPAMASNRRAHPAQCDRLFTEFVVRGCGGFELPSPGRRRRLHGALV